MTLIQVFIPSVLFSLFLSISLLLICDVYYLWPLMTNHSDSIEKAELETLKMFTCWENLWASQRKMHKSRFYGNGKYWGMQGTSQVVLVVKNPPAYAGHIRDEGLIPKLGRSPGGGHRNPLQYSRLENPMDRGAWWATVHAVKQSWTRLKQLSMHAQTWNAEPVVLVHNEHSYFHV